MKNEEFIYNMINDFRDDLLDTLFRKNLKYLASKVVERNNQDNSLEYLGLTGKALRQLNNNDIKTVEDLQKFTTPLMMLGCIGAETFEDIINFADKFEIKLHPCNNNLVSFCRSRKKPNIKMYKKGE